MIIIAPRTSAFHLKLDAIAPDKSISHRCAIFSLLSDKPSVIYNYLLAEDTLHTLEIARHMGLHIKELEEKGSFCFTPPRYIQEPSCVLDCGNAGTAMRLYTGLLCAQKGHFVLSGDRYLCARPMQRVIEPLRAINARIASRDGGYAPLSIQGSILKGFNYQSPIASAQVKSAMLLAALFAGDASVYDEAYLTRNHSEHMLRGMGANIVQKSPTSLAITPLSNPLEPLSLRVPADPSSAFFFALAAAITPGASVLLKHVLLNPTRIEAFRVLEQMGAIVEYHKLACEYEEIGDIYVAHAPLCAVNISHNIAWLIDELPALAVAFCFAEGKSEVSGAKELRVKETDRIHAIVQNLQALGITCEEKDDGFCIQGLESSQLDMMQKRIDPPLLNSFYDHRIAMSLAILGLRIGACINEESCIAISFPNFLTLLREITQVYEK